MPVRKLVLCVGPRGVGKTSLLHRFEGQDFDAVVRPTVGLDERPEIILLDPIRDFATLPPETRSVLPRDGLEIEFWEIGGKELCRPLPRGRLPNGLLVCFSHRDSDRRTFHAAKHQLMHYRMEWHLASEGATFARGPSSVVVPRLAVVLCGTKADELRGNSVSIQEASEYAKSNGIYLSVPTSAATGEGNRMALYAVAQSLCEVDAERSAEIASIHGETGEGPFSIGSANAWSLPLSDKQAMTQPRGLRPCEPSRFALPAVDLVEVFASDEIAPYCARPLTACLELGLLHRAVHVWLCDIRTGALLLRNYGPASKQYPSLWGPSAHTEVRSYAVPEVTDGNPTGPLSSEDSTMAAARALKDQLGLSQAPRIEDLLFSSNIITTGVRELLEVFVVPVESGAPLPLKVQQGEQIQWMHFSDVFRNVSSTARAMVQFDSTYRCNIMQRLRARFAHASCS